MSKLSDFYKGTLENNSKALQGDNKGALEGAIKNASTFLGSLFTGKTDTAAEMLSMWQKDKDGGLSEFVRWTINDGEYPKEETLAVLSYLQIKKPSEYLNIQTNYGDTLSVTHIINKLTRNGFAEQAKDFSSNLDINDLKGNTQIDKDLIVQTKDNFLEEIADYFDDEKVQNQEDDIQINPSSKNIFSLKNIAIGIIIIWLIKKLFK